MTRENLIVEIAQSLCASADKTKLLQVYYNESYDWLESLSKEELLDQAIYTLGEKVELDD